MACFGRRFPREGQTTEPQRHRGSSFVIAHVIVIVNPKSEARSPKEKPKSEVRGRGCPSRFTFHEPPITRAITVKITKPDL
jgi:hypothetical protein